MAIRNVVAADDQNEILFDPASLGAWLAFKIDEGVYRTVDRLVDVMNQKASVTSIGGGDTLSDIVRFGYNLNTMRIDIQAYTSTSVKFKFEVRIGALLGFVNDVEYNVPADTIMSAPARLDLCGNLYYMYVYCDIVKQSIVGNSYVPLLRSVTINYRDDTAGQFATEMATNTYSLPLYVPVGQDRIGRISFTLADHVGQPIAFDSFSSVVLTLHFRRTGLL